MIYVYILAGIIVVWLGVMTYLRKVWFYRDPERKPESTEPGVILSPADGRVVYIKKFEQGGIYSEKLGEKIPLPEITGCETPLGDGWAIGIYMSPLDVHFNFCPHPGKVDGIFRKSVKYNFPMLDLWEYIRVMWFRKFVDMFAKKYHLENERNTIFFDCGGTKMAAVLIADKFVAKISCYVEEGQELDYSEKIGFIERGSQVDLVIFSNNVEFCVGLNQQVYGGQTVIARLKAGAGVGAERKDAE